MDARKQMRAVRRLAGCVAMGGICLLPLWGKTQTSGGAKATAPEELRTLITTALGATRSGNPAKVKEIARDLMIPDYELWFKATFGEEQGARLGAAYAANLDEAEKWYPKLFEWLAQQEGELGIEDAKTLPKRSDSWCGQTLANALKSDIVLYRESVG